MEEEDRECKEQEEIHKGRTGGPKVMYIWKGIYTSQKRLWAKNELIKYKTEANLGATREKKIPRNSFS